MTHSAPTHTAVAAGLAASGLTKSFGSVRALADVDLVIRSGEAVSIMGPSGSGKSTLLHCLAGILVPDAGTVTLGADRVSALPDAARSRLRRERFGFVFQDNQLLTELPADENVALPLLLTGRPRPRAIALARDWMARFGLAGLEGRRPGELSGGQAQRVAIARALVGRPAVVFADEPTGALDQATGAEVMSVLTDAASDLGSTPIVVTHDPHVAGWCSRHVELRDGRVSADERR